MSEGRQAEVRGLSEGYPAEVRGTLEGRQAEVCGLSEGYPAEVRGLSEGRQAEVRGMGEFCPTKVRGLSEGHGPEGCGLSEGRGPEVRGSSEFCPAEVRGSGEDSFGKARFVIEPGRSKIGFFNRELAKRVENWCSAEIEIETTPCTRRNGNFAISGWFHDATTLAHLNEDSAPYVLFFVELCIICGDIFRFFIFIRVYETFKYI